MHLANQVECNSRHPEELVQVEAFLTWKIPSQESLPKHNNERHWACHKHNDFSALAHTNDKDDINATDNDLPIVTEQFSAMMSEQASNRVIIKMLTKRLARAEARAEAALEVTQQATPSYAQQTSGPDWATNKPQP